MIGPNGGQDITRIDPEMWGILPRASEFLLGYLNQKSAEGNLTYSVKASFMQIYNENLYDLLHDSGAMFDDRPISTAQDGDLKIREVPKPKSLAAVSGVPHEIYISGLSEFRVQTAEDILKILAIGTGNRMTRSTDYNATSSRSHALLTLTFEIETQIDSGQTLISRSKLHLIDLAGSEKMNNNSSLDVNNPRHVKELSSINKSLSALGNVISALASTSRSHIPYRDSKLTRILQDSLGGNSRTVLIACVAPTILHSVETLSTLQFAERAKNVRLIVKANTVIDDKVTLAKAQAEIGRLKVLLSHALKQLEEKTTLTQNNGVYAGGGGGGNSGNNPAEFEQLVLENDELKRQNDSLRRLARVRSSSLTPISDRRGSNNNKEKRGSNKSPPKAGFLSKEDRFGRRSSFDSESQSSQYQTPQQQRRAAAIAARRKNRRQQRQQGGGGGYDSDGDADMYYGGRRGRQKQFRGGNNAAFGSDDEDRYSFQSPPRKSFNKKINSGNGSNNSKYSAGGPSSHHGFGQVFRAVQERQQVELATMLEEAQRKLQQQILGDNYNAGMNGHGMQQHDAMDVSNMILASGIMGSMGQQPPQMMMPGMIMPQQQGQFQQQQLHYQGTNNEFIDPNHVPLIGSNGMEAPIHVAGEEKFIPINIINTQEQMQQQQMYPQESPTMHTLSPQQQQMQQQMMMPAPSDNSTVIRAPPSSSANNNSIYGNNGASSRSDEPSYTARINSQNIAANNDISNNAPDSQRSNNQGPVTPSLPVIEPPTNRIFRKGKGGSNAGSSSSSNNNKGLTGVDNPYHSNKGSLPAVLEVKSGTNSPATTLFSAVKATNMFQGLVRRSGKYSFFFCVSLSYLSYSQNRKSSNKEVMAAIVHLNSSVMPTTLVDPWKCMHSAANRGSKLNCSILMQASECTR